MFFKVTFDSFPEEDVDIRIFLHFLFPLRPFEVFVDFDDIFEVVEGKNSTSFVDDEHGEKAKLHINVCC